ncbi:xanthine dehydrogenase family protein molybdopterin-binding subunit [Lutispora saccharofermentans]|uniref:Molybdopterin-dependent oxidoreductase n=1 Tax=Lutispora saccharofermentans TaxID=3024236 RepID=A0ABT1NFB2_9FIRM|nr:molybdopterin cofactor-binding domain-containing protein [Lutispora saccharofermentans]MCQ1528858.1 molybdopterin-dependent oxidoreductase [Lutispora saccharofermentans]
MDDFKVVGKSHPRLESAAKVTGQAKYVDDYVLPHMVYGMILRSPYAHARVKSIDKTRAEKVPGVLKVLLPEDMPDKLFNCSGNPPSPLLIEDERILTDHPLYMGDRIAAVAAVTKEACREALDELIIEYEELPALFDVDDALKEDAPLLHPEISGSNVVKKIEAEQGDVDKGFEESDYVFEDTYYTPMIQNVSMEPNSCICDYTFEGKLNIISTSQTPFQERRVLAKLMGMAENDVRITKPMMGGGFGERQQLHNQHVGAILSKSVGRPVKIINTREEQMYASVVRHSARITLKIGVSKDGYIKALKAKAYYNTGAYTTHGPTVVAAGSRKVNYRIPNYLFEGYCVYTNSPVSGAVRGYGNPQMTFAREVMLNTIAKKLNMDPIEFKMKNHVRVGDKLPAASAPLLSCAVEECLNKGEEIRRRIDEEEARNSSNNDTDIKEAWGTAFCCHTSGPSSKEGMSSSVVLINDDGTANLLMGSADIGQGSETILGQIAAEGLGIDLKDITITAADTKFTPYDTGTFASSQTYVGGNAVFLAVKDARERIMKALARIYETVGDDIVFENGRFVVKSPDKNCELTFKEAVSKVTFGQKGVIITGSSSYKAEEAPPPFAICWAKVAVDMITGSVQLKHIIEAVDVGKAINPEFVEGQVQGGVSMGIGYAMMEQIEIDKKTKKVLSSDLINYEVPLTLDMPEIHVYIADGYEPTGPFGAKSVGELATVPVAAAIAIAISNAAGEEIKKIPITHSYIAKGLRA